MLAGKKPIVACQGDVAASGDHRLPQLCCFHNCLPIMPKEKSMREAIFNIILPFFIILIQHSWQYAGGFYMAMGCPIIVAQPLTITGLNFFAVLYSVFSCCTNAKDLVDSMDCPNPMPFHH